VSRYARRPNSEGHAGALELFYDLVFVFAVTQVSHLLLAHLTWQGVGQSALILLVVWWAWNYTTWVTNELDLDATPVRLMLIAVMLASLLMAVAIPHAFGADALLFAGSYVAIQVGRHVFLAFVVADPGTIERERALQILLWFVFAGVFWIGGALAEGTTRTVLWLVALVIDYYGPVAVYRVPGRPKLDHSTWNVSTGHFVERFQLFIIIALGESIVITGATTTELGRDAATLAAFALAFLGSAALWWIYFNYAARMAERRLELAENRTVMARDAYTYLHVVMVAGIIVAAVGDELVIAHPTEELPGREIAAVVAGPAIYLLAQGLFRLRMAGSVSRKRFGGALACLVAGGLGAFAPALVVAGAVVAILVAVIAAETVSGARRRRRGELAPLEALDAATAPSPPLR
jgi:low temperature requirement protein LtrA